MIDVTKAPYYVTADWKRSDATATDNWAALQEAANDAGHRETDQYIDFGRHNGDVLQLPAGSIMVSNKLVLPWGVSLRGAGQASTQLVLKETFPANQHFIDLGDATTQTACFGSSVKDLGIWSPRDMPANYGTYMIYSNNAQDEDPIIGNVRIQAGRGGRSGVKYEIGYGGATKVNIRQLTVACAGPNTFPLHVNCSGSTMVSVDGFEPDCGWIDDAHPEYGARVNSIGMVCAGGSFRLTNFHPEKTETCVFFNMYGPGGSANPDPQCMAECSWFTGGGGLKNLVSIYNNANQKEKIWLDKLMRKGSWVGPTVQNSQPGGANIMTDVMERIRL